jgi:hypothetical protein
MDFIKSIKLPHTKVARSGDRRAVAMQAASASYRNPLAQPRGIAPIGLNNRARYVRESA